MDIILCTDILPALTLSTTTGTTSTGTGTMCLSVLPNVTGASDNYLELIEAKLLTWSARIMAFRIWNGAKAESIR